MTRIRALVAGVWQAGLWAALGWGLGVAVSFVLHWLWVKFCNWRKR